MDIIFNEDISVKSGNFEIGNNDKTKAEDILQAGKGSFFWNPLLGYGIRSKINSNLDFTEEQGKIISELKKENIKFVDLEIVENNYNLSIE